MKLLLRMALIILLLNGCGTSKQITITSPPGSTIYKNKSLEGSSPIVIKIPKNDRVNIFVTKPGHISEEKNYTNDKYSKLPKSDFFDLEKDISFEESYSTDVCNRDVDIPTSKSEDEAWKTLGQIVTNYFDVLEVVDKNTGYLRTAWEVKTFNSGKVTIRTRLIIKLGNSNPLSYKVKLVSEKALGYVSSKKDEQFEEWDRLLRTYENIVPEIQNRLSLK